MILVTGATGFLGSHLVCQLLLQHKKVKALKRTGSAMAEFQFVSSLYFLTAEQLANLTWAEADLLNVGDLELAFTGVNEVIHCAAMVSFQKKDAHRMMQNNVTGTANMVNLALHFSVQKFGYVSSTAALGRAVNGQTMDEKSEWEENANNTQYAESKHLAELEVWRGIQEGLPAVIVNPAIIIGAGNFTRGTGKMFQLAAKGFRFYTPGINGFVDVRDVARILIELMERNITHERFVLVSENIPYRTFYEEAARQLNTPPPSVPVPAWAAHIGTTVLGFIASLRGTSPLLTKETTHAAYQQYYYSNRKITALLDYEFIPIAETIRWACSYYPEK